MDFQTAALTTEDKLAQELATSLQRGLTTPLAKERLTEFGANQIKEQKFSCWRSLWQQVNSSFTYLLVAAGVIAVSIGDRLEALLILLFVGINTVIGFYQEYKSNQSLAVLKSYLVPTCRVIRDGQKIDLKTHDLVPGDLVELSAGDVVGADVRLISADNFSTDESTISGESVAVAKNPQVLTATGHGIYGASNIAFALTTVTSGQARGLVINTGQKCVIGEIVGLAQTTEEKSIFEKNLDEFSKFVVWLVGFTILITFIANLVLDGRSISLGELLLFSIALAVSAVPEALPLVTTFTLSRGALSLAREHVVVKRLSAIEDLGGIEVLCTDKTGTLTEGRMSVAKFLQTDQFSPLLISSLSIDESDHEHRVNQFNQAILSALTDAEQLERDQYHFESFTPFDPVRRYDQAEVSRGSEHITVFRGAPEVILAKCQVTGKIQLKEIDDWIRVRGEAGERALAIAVEQKGQFNLAGLISFSDPLKETALEAVRTAETLGVAVKILTGDRPEVAGVVARQVGLIQNLSEVLTGADFEKMSPAQKESAVSTVAVFARVTPQQKFEIIKLLMLTKRVGFLGEGINDAAALKMANVGLIVQGGADLARESADIILLRRDLRVIIDGIYQGRTVFTNTAKYIRATLASNFGNLYAIAFASFLLPVLPMLPIQILLLNLLSDLPMMAISTDRVNHQEIRRPFSNRIRDIAKLAAWLGIVSTGFDLLIFFIFREAGGTVLQTNWFIFSVATELLFLFSIRASGWFWQASAPSWPLLGLSVCCLALAVVIPFSALGQRAFSFSEPAAASLLIIAIVALGYFACSELTKRLVSRTVI